MARPEENRSVLITGCSSGIGEATAALLARGDWTVYATARRPETLQELKELGCHTLALDVTDEASMRAAVDAVEADHGSVGALVNNAGYSLSGALETLDMDDVRQQFETNVFGLLRLTQMVLPGMRRAGDGRIVNVGSMGGRLTFPGGGAYHATKHALEALSDALRFEVRGFGVKVVLLEPGLIVTRFADAVEEHMDDPSEDQGPYAEFNAGVLETTKEVYAGGPLRALGGGPDSVAKVIEKALNTSAPKARYRVTPSAHLLMTVRRLMPDRLWDAMLGGTYPTPGA